MAAALKKGRETRARNKAQKEQLKSQKLQMLEKIHSRVESFDMNSLMRKIENIAQTKVETVKQPKQSKQEPSCEIEEPSTPPPEEEPEEEESGLNAYLNNTIERKTNTFGSGLYDFISK